ncbi:hypothetical protein [Micromonospora okii]|uniref:hypothetical protein n=1 Tax=Micromonospora okii TaxID=1182970 RepID=UPI001E564CE6|nr:hypothetical protein [Micromonospora okii]
MDGREPAESTRYYYDRRGRVARSVTVREPEWTEQDRAEILALGHYRAQRCPCGCGQRYADVTSPEEGGPQFVAERLVCRARLALLEAQKAAETRDIVGGARLWHVRMVGGEG